MVREVGFTADEQPANRAHQVVVHPQPAHGVVRRGVDTHRHVVRVFAGDALVHLEKIAVTFTNGADGEASDRIREIQKHSAAAWPNAATLVADLFGSP